MKENMLHICIEPEEAKMSRKPISGDYAFLCRAYLDGDANAIKVIDTCIAHGVDLAYLREWAADIDWEVMKADYLEIRQELDEDIDTLNNTFPILGISPTIAYAMKEENNGTRDL